jgi:hypothetical protein
MDKSMETDLDDIFDIPEQEESSKESNEDFDDKLEEVANVLSDADAEKTKQLGVETTQQSQDNAVDEDDQSPEATQSNIPGSWLLESPAPKFNKFYKEKEKLIKKILIDGPIPFARYRKDLKDSHVDISIVTFDQDEIYKKMSAVQGFKDRVTQIQIHCNSQFFLWERGVQLMHGLLAQVAYEKPVTKYDGIVYEHLYDMEVYFLNMKGVHKAADAVMKTLEGAYECLSRRVTIATPFKPLERYQASAGGQGYQVASAPSQELQDYDVLSSDKIAKDSDKKSKGPQNVDWGEI